MSLNYVGSYIYSPHWTKIKKATIDPVNKKKIINALLALGVFVLCQLEVAFVA